MRAAAGVTRVVGSKRRQACRGEKLSCDQINNFPGQSIIEEGHRRTVGATTNWSALIQGVDDEQRRLRSFLARGLGAPKKGEASSLHTGA